MSKNQIDVPHKGYSAIAHDLPISIEGLAVNLERLSNYHGSSERFLRQKAKEYAHTARFILTNAKSLRSYVQYLEILAEKGGENE